MVVELRHSDTITASLFLLTLSTTTCALVSANPEKCFQNPIPAVETKNISIAGVSTPVRIGHPPWSSATLIAKAVDYILRVATTNTGQRMGYATELVAVANSSEAWHLLADCDTLNSSTACRPGSLGSGGHLAFEIWHAYSLGLHEKLVREVPGRVPIRVGYPLGMGADGYESMFIKGATVAKARSNGIFLQWFESWKGLDVSPYFDTHVNVVAPDNAYGNDYLQGTRAEAYVNATGDKACCSTVNGTYKWNLQNGWALSPACRMLLAQGRSCVPLISYNGWGFPPLFQFANFFKMPIAFGAYSWSNYVDIPKKKDTLIYWWLPDDVFIDLDMKDITFPLHNADEHAQGIYKTQVSAGKLWKMTHAAIPFVEPNLYQFMERFSLSLQSILGLVTESYLGKSEGLTEDEVVCKWLLENRVIWERWIPDRKDCILSKGLVDNIDRFVTSISEASECKFCSSGRRSVGIITRSGPTFICELCKEGSFAESNGMTECTLCDAGLFSSVYGASACERCPVGTFSSTAGSTACAVCSDPHHTTAYKAATVEAECLCRNGFYLRPNHGCTQCGEGLKCVMGNDPPWQDEGYSVQVISQELREYSVYRCPIRHACPAGGVAKCSGNASGTMCLQCPDWMYWDEMNCSHCGPRQSVLVYVLVSLLLSFPVITYVVLQKCPYGAQNEETTHVAKGMSILGLIVVFVQTLIALKALNLSWANPFKSILEAMYHLDPNLFTGSCTGFQKPLIEFGLKMLYPLWAAITLLVSYIVLTFVLKRPGYQFANALNTLGRLGMIFYLPLVMLSFAPYHCFSHPNGTKSVDAFPSVVCDYNNAKHLFMASVGGFGVIFFSASFLSTVAYLIWIYPRHLRRGNETFLQASSFLFVKWKPRCYWYGLVELTRSFLFAMLPRVLPDASTHMLFVFMQTILLCSIFLTVRLLPCRWPILNFSDLIINGTLLYIMLVGAIGLPAKEMDFVESCVLCVMSILGVASVIVIMFRYVVLETSRHGRSARVRKSLSMLSEAISTGVSRRECYPQALSMMSVAEKQLLQCKWTRRQITEFIQAEEKRQSESGGISIEYVLSVDFLILAREKSAMNEPSFDDLKDPFFLGQDALGKEINCPRDGEPGCALIDFLPRRYRGACTHFLSWCWAYKVTLVQDALGFWLDNHPSLDASEIFMFSCFFVNNQYRILVGGSGAGSADLEIVFEKRLAKIGHVIALLDHWHKPRYLTRIWTIFEVFTAAKLGIETTMIFPRNESASLIAELGKGEVGISNVTDMLTRVDSRAATAFYDKDEAKVKDLIRNSIGFPRVNEAVCESMTTWIAKSVKNHFDMVVYEKVLRRHAQVCNTISRLHLQGLKSEDMDDAAREHMAAWKIQLAIRVHFLAKRQGARQETPAANRKEYNL